ncbi:MAG: acyl-CoA thioesterase [Pseudomonadales bacterium]
MGKKISKIVDFLQLERIEENIFRGESRDMGTPQVFGGQVLGQAMEAASCTVEDRAVHSVHAYFLRRGDFNAPIVYEVDRSRDGRSFSARRVVAIQHGRPIFTMSASFQTPEEGLESARGIVMPALPENADKSSGKKAAKNAVPMPHSDFKVWRLDEEQRTDKESFQWWMRTRDTLPDDPRTHASVLAYISDFGLLGSAILPLTEELGPREARRKEIQFASIDHTIWFHRPFRMDEWLLYYCRSISNSQSRGLAQGSVYNRDGLLVASTMQEGLVRVVGDVGQGD